MLVTNAYMAGPVPAKGMALSELPVGALVRDDNSKIWDVPIIWKVADHNHAGYPADSATLITERIISLQCFDAKEPSNTNADRKSYGNNRYSVSNIRQWLNSDAAAGAWYAAQHSADAPPISENVDTGWNDYDTWAGFLNTFSARFKTALLNTTLTVAKNTITDGGGSETVTDKIFLASNTEAGLANENSIAEGALLAMFAGNDAARIAQVTTEGIANSTYTSNPANNAAAWFWLLRTINNTNPAYVSLVGKTGKVSYGYADGGYAGTRPLCNLPSTTQVSLTPDANGIYTILF
jgi:hypothetical protein